jgi:hypothetical protein
MAHQYRPRSASAWGKCAKVGHLLFTYRIHSALVVGRFLFYIQPFATWFFFTAKPTFSHLMTYRHHPHAETLKARPYEANRSVLRRSQGL